MKNTHLQFLKLIAIKTLLINISSFVAIFSYAQNTYCTDYELTSNNGQIKLSNLQAPIEIIDIYDANWQLIFNCRGTDCGNEIILSDLSASVHHINIQAYTANWEFLCREQLDVLVTEGNTESNKSDLTLSNLRDLAQTVEQGSVQTFTFDLNNIGSQTAFGAYRIDFYLIPQPEKVDTDTPVGSINTGNTPVGTIADVTGAITVPSDLAPGLYYLIGLADEGGEIDEQNENNNFVVTGETQRIEVIKNESNNQDNMTISCNNILINYGENSISMNGSAGTNYFFKVYDLNNGWAEVFNCSYNCGSRQTVNNLSSGNYLARIYNSNWETICEQNISLSSGTPSNNGCPSIPSAPVSNNFSYIVSDITEGDKSITIHRLNDVGTVTQTNTYQLTIPGVFNQEFSRDIKIFDDHIIVGITGIFDNGVFKYILLKIDLNGNLIWQKLNDYQNGSNESITILEQAQNGGYYLKFLGQGRQVLAGTDNQGNQQWQESITAIVFDKYFYDFVGEVSDGSAFFLNVYEDNFLLFVQKRSVIDGAIIWNELLNTPGEQIAPRPFSLITDDDGIITRYTWRDRNTDFTLTDGFNYRKLSTNGETDWVQELSQAILATDKMPDLLAIEGDFYLNAIDEMGNNDLYVINSEGTLSACDETNPLSPIGSCSEITVTVASNSIEIQGQRGKEYFFKIHDLNNSWAEVFSCAYSCGSNQTAENLPNSRLMVRVYNDSWNLICEQEVNLGADSRNRFSSLETFSIYPNPAQEELFIELSEFKETKGLITITNIFGQIIYQQAVESIPSDAFRLPLENYANGFYFIHLNMKNRRIKSEKFLVKRLY